MKLNGQLLDRLGQIQRAFRLHPAAQVDVELDPGRVHFFRKEALPICAPDARLAAIRAARSHMAQHGPLGVETLAPVAAEAYAHSCWEQIQAGELGANAPATTLAKARRGQPSTRGVAEGDLVAALLHARAYDTSE